MSLAGEKLDAEINLKLKEYDFVTKSYLDMRISQLEAKIEKGFRETLVWVTEFMAAIVGIAVAIIKLF